MVCLDTDFLVAVNRNHAEALRKLEGLEKAGQRLTVTPIAITEFLEGSFSTGSEDKVKEAENLLRRLKMLEYDFYAAKEAAKIFSLLSRAGSKIGDMDTLIGAIALTHDETLLTRNARHFGKIPGLKVEKW